MVAILNEERRNEILKILHWRKYEKIKNLAFELGVSERTIRRDISILSITAPIYTQSGRYDGGVYILDDENLFSKIYVSDSDLNILDKILLGIENDQLPKLSVDEKTIFKRIVENYRKIKK